MASKIKCFFSWSGGKDSSLALYRLLKNPVYEICYLVTTVNEGANRISMHGVREELLLLQAESIGIPLYQIRLPKMPDTGTYNRVMHQHYLNFKEQGITHAAYGDIFLQDLKAYRDARLAEAGLIGVYPLWQQDTQQLLDEFWSVGFKTIIACTQASLGHMAGQELTAGLVNTFPAGVDVCGENGEFHTFAFEGPIFQRPIKVSKGEKVFRSFQAPKQTDSVHANASLPELAGFWYCDLLPA
jgi:uncharacterized protein (TIGR00290 family)